MPDKPTWIAVAGSYRTGSTTHYQLIRDVVETYKKGTGIGYHTEGKLSSEGEGHDKPSKGPYVIVKVFRPFFDPEIIVPRTGEPSRMVEFLKENRLKAMVSIRHPLDIITSMKKRSDGRGKDGGKDEWDFETVAKEHLPGWLHDSCAWIDLGNPYSKFEEFTVDLHSEVRKIAEFLDIPINTPDVNKIARRYTIDSQIRRASRLREHNRKASPEKQKKEDPWLPGIPGIVFGTSGNWKTWLSGVEQRMVRESCGWFIERFEYE